MATWQLLFCCVYLLTAVGFAEEFLSDVKNMQQSIQRSFIPIEEEYAPRVSFAAEWVKPNIRRKRSSSGLKSPDPFKILFGILDVLKSFSSNGDEDETPTPPDPKYRTSDYLQEIGTSATDGPTQSDLPMDSEDYSEENSVTALSGTDRTWQDIDQSEPEDGTEQDWIEETQTEQAPA